MSKILGEILIKKPELRPCYVNGKKALFHMWGTSSEIIPPSPMVGGHNGGNLIETVGIVEYEDGTVHCVLPSKIEFSNDLFKEYAFRKDFKECQK